MIKPEADDTDDESDGNDDEASVKQKKIKPTSNKHYGFMNEVADQFVGRKTLLQKVIAILNDNSSVNEGKCLVNIIGKSGFGKTAFMVTL